MEQLMNIPNDNNTQQNQNTKREFKSAYILVDQAKAESKFSVLIDGVLKNNFTFWISKKSIFKNEFAQPWIYTISIDVSGSTKYKIFGPDKKEYEIDGKQLYKAYSDWVYLWMDAIGNEEKLVKLIAEDLKKSYTRQLIIERMIELCTKFIRAEETQKESKPAQSIPEGLI